jgi:hypothetical protein
VLGNVEECSSDRVSNVTYRRKRLSADVLI